MIALPLLASLAGSPARAQLQLVDDRVRVTAPAALSMPATGRVAATDSLTLSLRLDQDIRLVVPLDAIASVEISRGRPLLRNIVIGAGGGLIIGSVAGAIIGLQADESGLGSFFGLVAGGAFGIPAGAAAGAIATRERWSSPFVPPHSSAGADPIGVARLVVPAGARLRVSPASGERFAGRSLTAESGVRVEHDGRIRDLQWAEIARLEARGGRNRRKGALWGASILGGVAVIAGGVDVGRGELESGEWAFAVISNALIGAGVGYLLAPRGWVDVPLPRRRS